MAIVFGLGLGACATSDCEDMCDSQKTCTEVGAGIMLTDDEVDGCVAKCEDDLAAGAVDTTILRCIADAVGECEAIDECND